ncbi:MAG: hypothetical protein KAG97_00925 [Victivallales bacterium]|nr:hypothetical protein [Victivallales bacterium]
MAGVYFFDDFALDRKINLARRYSAQQLHSSEPYVDNIGRVGYSSIHWCSEIDKYRMWYGRTTSTWKDAQNVILIESDDAKVWRAVNGGEPVIGDANTDVHGPGITRDPFDADPAKLYKLACSSSTPETLFKHGDCLVAFSPDGENWSDGDDSIKWGKYKSDTCNRIIFNPVRNVYQIFHRASLADRRIHGIYSKDLIHWSEPEVLLHPDPMDPDCCQFYGMSVSYFDGIFIGALWVYHTDPFDTVHFKMAGYTTSELVYSYDGFHWNRTHQNFNPMPDYPNYGSGSMYAGNTTADKSGKNWLTSSLNLTTQHGDVLTKNGDLLLYASPEFLKKKRDDEVDHSVGALEVYKTRADGLVGLYAYGVEANLLFKSVEILEGDLSFNINASRGRVLFQVCSHEAEPLPGFTFEESQPFTGDSTKVVPVWKNKSVADLKGMDGVRIELKLHSAVIYSMRGTFRPRHSACPQQSYGDPAPHETTVKQPPK